MDYTNKLGQATLSQGPAPTGRDKLFDALYNALGGTPDRRWAADKLTSALDWGTLGMLTGAYDGGRELAETGRPAALAMALMPGAKGVRAATEAAETAGRAGIRAFHGSPHDFDRFDLNKIGTGEGAQAYGHGLYFAENEGVARWYRDGLSPRQLQTADGKARPLSVLQPGLTKTDEDRVAALINEAGGYDAAVARAREVLDAGNDPNPMFAELNRNLAAEASHRLKLLEKYKGQNPEVKTTGRMYEVNIKANPEDFLDWDKPLSQQSEKVRAALQGIYPDGLPGGDVYQMMLHDARTSAIAKGNDAATSYPETMHRATDDLKSLGIPGIRYLDQGSRDAGEGSRNYVVFDDALIEILRKYGVLPPAVGGAAMAAQPGDASAQGMMP